jgi:hypothetical protein
MLPELCVLEAPALPLVAEPLTPPVPALALAEGDDPLCGRLEPLAELDGVEELAVVLVSADPLVLDGEAALAMLLSSTPWTFT